jgi:hypothetical protein
MKSKKTKPKRFVYQYKFPEHIRWQASAWSTNNRKDAIQKASEIETTEVARIWDRKKRCEQQ